MPEHVRAVYIYELHGHDRNGPLDYRSVFAGLSAMRPPGRRHLLPDDGRVLAIPEMRLLSDDRYALRFVIGREGDPALFYDIETGDEREVRAQANEMAALTAWLVIDVDQRVAVQERRRPGVPLEAIVDGLTAIVETNDLAQNPTLSLHPRVGEGFLAELEELESIKSAAIVLQRPNMSWTDSANSLVAELGQESNIGQVTIDARARPKESLTKDAGFVAELKAMVLQGWGPLRSAKLIGRKPGENRDSTVTTKKYAQRREVVVPDGATRSDEVALVLNVAETYLDEETSAAVDSNGKSDAGSTKPTGM